jgi:hypothetical protein
MSLEAGIGLFFLGVPVTVVFFYFLFKFMEATDRDINKDKDE